LTIGTEFSATVLTDDGFSSCFGIDHVNRYRASSRGLLGSQAANRFNATENELFFEYMLSIPV
jgi:hypothetical protein